jgi:hypothetical protein
MLRRICSCDGWRSSTFWIRRASRSLRSSLRIGLRAGENGALTSASVLLELYHRRFSIQIETADAESVLSRWV